jgi:hypothetical protein
MSHSARPFDALWRYPGRGRRVPRISRSLSSGGASRRPVGSSGLRKAPPPVCAHAHRGHCSLHDVKQPDTFSRCVRTRGMSTFPPREGWRSADRRPVLARHRWPAASHKECQQPLRHAAGRGACEAPRRPLRSGRRASRRSTPWRFSASGPRFRLRHFLRSTCSELLAARVVVPGERFPSLPSLRYERSRGTPHPAPPSGLPPDGAPHEQDMPYVA